MDRIENHVLNIPIYFHGNSKRRPTMSCHHRPILFWLLQSYDHRNASEANLKIMGKYTIRKTKKSLYHNINKTHKMCVFHRIHCSNISAPETGIKRINQVSCCWCPAPYIPVYQQPRSQTCQMDETTHSPVIDFKHPSHFSLEELNELQLRFYIFRENSARQELNVRYCNKKTG